MPRTLVGLLVDIVAGLVITGVVAALVVRASPVRPSDQAWLWLLALVSILAVGTTRRCLRAGTRRQGPLGWARRIRLRRGREH